MNIKDTQNTEFIKLQQPESMQSQACAVVNSNSEALGGSVLNNEQNSFAQELDFGLGVGNSKNDTGIFSFDFGNLQGLHLDEVSEDDFSEIENIDTANISREDANFFVSLVYQKDFNNLKAGSEKTEIIQNDRTVKTSQTVINLLTKASTEGKPVRLDFDNNITLVLKVGQDGKINANFFPSDKSAEEYLRNNISYLRQEFDIKNISYGSLNYFNQRNQNKQKEKKNE